MVLRRSSSLVELRTRHPLLDPRMFRHRAFAAGSVSIFVQFFAFFGFVFVVLQYLQLVRGDSPAGVGGERAADGGGDDADRTARARGWSARAGARRVCACRPAADRRRALVVLAQLDADSSYWLLLAGLLPLGAGMGRR